MKTPRHCFLFFLQLSAISHTTSLKKAPFPSVFDYLDGRKTEYYEGHDYFIHIPVAPPRWIPNRDEKNLKKISLQPDFLDWRLDHYQTLREANETWWKTVGSIKYAKNQSWAKMLKSIHPLVLAEEVTRLKRAIPDI
eukprot:764018-Hanusia_phi.AAC.1